MKLNMKFKVKVQKCVKVQCELRCQVSSVAVYIFHDTLILVNGV